MPAQTTETRSRTSVDAEAGRQSSLELRALELCQILSADLEEIEAVDGRVYWIPGTAEASSMGFPQT